MFSNNLCTYYIGTVNNEESFEDQFSTPIKKGDIVITDENDAAYIYTGSDWNLLSTSIVDDRCIKEPVYRELLPQICKCCGAPLHNHKCEYCGVEYA